MDRSIFGNKKHGRVRNTILRFMTGIAEIEYKSAKVKREWPGHARRMHLDRWARVSTHFEKYWTVLA